MASEVCESDPGTPPRSPRAEGPGFVQPPGDPELWMRCCQLSLAVYYPAEAVAESFQKGTPFAMQCAELECDEYDLLHFQAQGRQTQVDSLHKCQWLVACEPRQDATTAYVSFKGTDGLLDLMFVNVPTDTETHQGSRVHSGAWIGIQGELPEVLVHIRRAAEKHPGLKHVVFTGHSLGGAYAIVTLFELLADVQWPPQLTAEAVTFGAPFVLAQERVGAPLQIPRTVRCPRMTHFTFGFDIIPRAFCLSDVALTQWFKDTAACLLDEHVGNIPVVGAQVAKVLKQKSEALAETFMQKIEPLTRFRAAGTYVFLNSVCFRRQSGGPVRRTECSIVPGVYDDRGIPLNPVAEDLLSFLPAIGSDSPCPDSLLDTNMVVCQATADDHQVGLAYLPAVRHLLTNRSRWVQHGTVQAAPSFPPPAPAAGPSPWGDVAAALAQLTADVDLVESPAVAAAVAKLRRALAAAPPAEQASDEVSVGDVQVAAPMPPSRDNARCSAWFTRVGDRCASAALAGPSCLVAVVPAAVAVLAVTRALVVEELARAASIRGKRSDVPQPSSPRRRHALGYVVSRLDAPMACTYLQKRHRLPPGKAALLDGSLQQGGPLRVTSAGSGGAAGGATSAWIDTVVPQCQLGSHVTLEYSGYMHHVIWESRCESAPVELKRPSGPAVRSRPEGDVRDVRPLHPATEIGRNMLCARLEGRKDDDALALHYHKQCLLVHSTVRRRGGWTWVAERPYSVADDAACAAVAFLVVTAAAAGKLHSAEEAGVFGAGYNDNGQLGMGSKVKHRFFAPVRSLAGKDVVDVTCGSGETLALCRDGQVLGSGRNRDGSLGLGHKKTELSFTEVSLPVQAKQICSGYHHSIVLGVDGSVYVAGLNSSGQLGLGHTSDQTTFVKVEDLPDRIASAAAGENFSVLLAESGAVLTCGYNAGNLGLGDMKERSRFTVVASLSPEQLGSERVTKVACGKHDCMVLTDQGRLYGTGANKGGRLGFGNTTPFNLFRLVPLKFKVSDVSLGYTHTFVITADGGVRSCGCNDYGELGIDSTQSKSTFQVVNDLEGARCTSVRCGCYCTLVVTGRGDVLACGHNKRGNLGLGQKDAKRFTPVHQLRGAAAGLRPSRFNYNTFVLSSTRSMAEDEGGETPRCSDSSECDDSPCSRALSL
eukprot:TRINITY_DN43402_c0_g1_i1.p1 TRINITY_DN43402_c0_g1~~TRINITY_DN43402_c0_g1_i1.p1  ORF type:complete len:1176 (+),score=291.49 TRINITY_DN43402_c0_g1_i1:55-3528(+)